MNWLKQLLGAAPAPSPAAQAGNDAMPPLLLLLPAGTVLVDVRSNGEFESGHIEGALSLPLDRLQADIAQAVPDLATPLLLYCRSGARSGSACGVLAQMGYGQVSNGGGIGSLALRLNRRISLRR